MAKAPKVKKVSNSRPARWGRAVEGLRNAIAAAEEHETPEGESGELAHEAQETYDERKEELRGAISDEINYLEELRGEYEEWYDGMPESLQQVGTGEKLQEIVGMNIQWETDDSLEDATEVLDNCEGADLPLGFGRD